MERPQHELLAVASKSKQSRVTSLGIVIAIHVVIITALVVGLSNNQLRQKVMDISASVDRQEGCREGAAAAAARAGASAADRRGAAAANRHRRPAAAAAEGCRSRRSSAAAAAADRAQGNRRLTPLRPIPRCHSVWVSRARPTSRSPSVPTARLRT